MNRLIKAWMAAVAIMLPFTVNAQTEEPLGIYPSNDEPITVGPLYSQPEELVIDARNLLGYAPTNDHGALLVKRRSNATAALGVRMIDCISNMPSYLVAFYNEYAKGVEEVIAGGSNWVSDPAKGTYNDQYRLYFAPVTTFRGSTTFTFPVNANANVIAQAAQEAIKGRCETNWSEANCFMSFLTLCLNEDFPEAFWQSNHFNWGHTYSYSYNYYASMGNGTVEFEQTIYLTLKSSNYDHRITSMRGTNTVEATVGEFNNKVTTILTNCPQGNRYQQVVYLNDWLTHNNSYNTSASYAMTDLAWSPLSALFGYTGENAPVCEAYARAFKVLADRLDIPCVLADGFSKSSAYANGEAHMWNEVQMEDGKWYAVDVTWNDPIVSGVNGKVSGQENHHWLLLGRYDNTDADLPFEQSHIRQLTWNIEAGIVNRWDYTLQPLINDYGYATSSAIGSVRNHTTEQDAAYDLSGRRIPMTTAGKLHNSQRLLIVNGRKVAVR